MGDGSNLLNWCRHRWSLEHGPNNIPLISCSSTHYLSQAVLQRIQESRVPEGSGGDFTREKMNQSLLSIYRELRDNPLLIV